VTTNRPLEFIIAEKEVKINYYSTEEQVVDIFLQAVEDPVILQVVDIFRNDSSLISWRQRP